MKTFKDNMGREWSLSYSLGSAERIKAACGVDLLDLDEQSTGRVLNEVALIATMVFAACKPQIDKLGISDIEFKDAIDGDPLAAMIEAHTQELVNFTPPDRRAVMRKLLEKMNELTKATTERAEKAIEGPIAELMQRELEAFDKKMTTLGAKSGSSPELSA